jgi:hypothetical protein
MAGKNGGARAGSGRKRAPLGSVVSTAKASVIKENDLTPLQVMQDNMMWYVTRALNARAAAVAIKGDNEKANEQRSKLIYEAERLASKSQSCATDTAPYLHPRLQSIEGNANKPVTHTLVVKWQS